MIILTFTTPLGELYCKTFESKEQALDFIDNSEEDLTYLSTIKNN